MRVAYVDGQAAGDERAGIGGSGGGRQAKIAMSRQRRGLRGRGLRGRGLRGRGLRGRGLRGRGLRGRTDGRAGTSNPAAQ